MGKSTVQDRIKELCLVSNDWHSLKIKDHLTYLEELLLWLTAGKSLPYLSLSGEDTVPLEWDFIGVESKLQIDLNSHLGSACVNEYFPTVREISEKDINLDDAKGRLDLLEILQWV